MSREILGHRVTALPLVAAFGLLGGAIALAVATGSPWWLVPLGMLGPDLSFLLAVGQRVPGPERMPSRAIRGYNLVHRPVTPLALLVVAAWLATPWLAVLTIAWLSHIVWDRAVGYGLRDGDGAVIPPRRHLLYAH